MKIVVGWAIAAVAGLVLLSACGGGGGDGSPPPAQETTTPGVTPEVEEEAPDRSELSFVDNLLAKVEDGEWTLGEGLVATLKLAVGELDAASVLRHPDLIRPEGTGILQMAHEYLDAGPDEEAKAEITRLLDLLVFSNDQLEAMAGLGQPTAALLGRLAPGAALGSEENCKLFFYGQSPPGVSQCLEFQFYSLDDPVFSAGPEPIRIFFPAPSLPAAGWTQKHYDLAVAAAQTAWPVYAKLGKMPPVVNIVFSVSLAGNFLAQAWSEAGKPCGVAVYTSMQGLPDGEFEQTIAHELAHCFQEEEFTEQNRADHEAKRWREEGLADYLSNVVYDKVNFEWNTLKFLAFQELTTTLFDRSYENFLFFQYLENIVGIDGIFDLVRSLPGFGGRPEQEAALAAYPGIDEIYHDFARAMTDGQIQDTGGGLIPYEGPSKLVEIDREATPYLKVPIRPFGVSRYLVFVSGTKQAALEFRPQGLIRESARPPDVFEWSEEVPSELPDKDCGPATMVVVTNTEPDGGFELDVPEVLDVIGARGLEGEWAVDNDSILGTISRRIALQTLDSIGGEIRATFRDDGKLEVVYDGFEVSSHSDVRRDEAETHYEETLTTEARGVDSYEVKGDYIFYGSLFEQSFLVGTATRKSVREAYGLKLGDYGFPIEEVDETTTETERLGWELFGAAQKYDLQCNGTILQFLSGDEVWVILHRVGFAD
ncbi:MAG: DUF6055 domain-containing protein [Dehalococcoidia bacterium]|nr:DUF6055 domain-containing protein [Dehalococcoidia bacterium]